MSKRPPFDAGILKQNKPSQSLKPFDYMKPMEEAPAVDDAATTETAPADTTPTDESTRTLERESANGPVAPATAVRPTTLTPVDMSEKPFNRGFHMYPSRHEQLLDLAYIEKRKPWEIIEQALAEYVRRHYGSKAGK
jgi:hypothetical protein